MTRHSLSIYTTAYCPDLEEENKTFADIGEIAKIAEEFDLDGVLLLHNHRTMAPWIVAAAILQQTRKLVPLVAVQPYANPPATIAANIKTLSALYGRRVDLNLITGASAAELERIGDNLDHDERYGRLTEHADIVRAMLTSRTAVTYSGKHYSIKNFDTTVTIDDEKMPRFFLAGSSDSAMAAARAVADFHVTRPRPVDDFRTDLAGMGGTASAISLGVLPRSTDAEAWEEARARYPDSRLARIRTSMQKESHSTWTRQLAVLATEGELYDDVYWLGAFRNGKGAYPLLVGSYARVVRYLEKYVEAGACAVIAAGLYSREDYEHASVVFTMLRQSYAGEGAEVPPDA